MSNTIQVGSRITVELDGQQQEFRVIEGENPGEYQESVITADSQMGQQLLGRQEGDIIEIVIEDQPRQYRVVSVSN